VLGTVGSVVLALGGDDVGGGGRAGVGEGGGAEDGGSRGCGCGKHCNSCAVLNSSLLVQCSSSTATSSGQIA
jgi:hypothetical protein